MESRTNNEKRLFSFWLEDGFTFKPNTHFLQIFEFNFDNQSWDLVSCKFSAI